MEILNPGYYTKLTSKSEVEICLQEISNNTAAAGGGGGGGKS
jgi:hypothetical protein